MNALVPRATVAQICGHRLRALELYGEAYDALTAANQAIRDAGKALRLAAPTPNPHGFRTDDEKKCFLIGLDVPERTAFLTTARAAVDKDVWAHLVEITDLERLMDKKAKDQLRQQLLRDPPEATEENIFATFAQMAADSGLIFRRGIAECFSNLDRRFRSHDGWKIGSRVVLTSAFGDGGHWSYYANHRDTIRDIERVFFVLDGKEMPPAYAGLVGDIDRERAGRFGARQSMVETDYFRLRCFKNGNAHVWFKRDDLLDKVNQLLGEYYGAAIPEEREPDAATGLNDPKTSLAKNYGFFPTPVAAADQVVKDANLYRREGEPVLTVLEPSAGLGHLAIGIVKAGAIVDCVEIHPERVASLRFAGRYRRVVGCDFLTLQPTADLYDRVVMNPPFDRERDIDHVMHALKFLKPTGFLVAIMSAGTEFRETRKSTAFRALMEQMNARWWDLPAGSFASVGTNVNTVMLRVWKDGRGFW